MAKELVARLDQHILIQVVVKKGRSKEDRARPISMVWEQGRVFHLGMHELLEEQLTGWVPGEVRGFSPDRVDAMLGHALALPGVWVGWCRRTDQRHATR